MFLSCCFKRYGDYLCERLFGKQISEFLNQVEKYGNGRNEGRIKQ